ncbi:MAG: hypothetical protein ACQKBV_07810 [Puniceicoccales bacterium]
MARIQSKQRRQYRRGFSPQTETGLGSGSSDAPVPRRSRNQAQTLIRLLLWGYIVLLIFDGALRKWFVPALSDVFLVSRIPVMLAIYALAFQSRLFVVNGFVIGAALLATVTFPLGVIAHGSPVVATYGLLVNFLPIPLIFIIPKVFDRDDVEKVGLFFLYLVLPMTLLIGLQFYAPQSAWVNRSVGGVEGAGFDGALGRFRPPGTFSFITGVAQFYTLAFAFFLAQYVNRKTLPQWLLLTLGAAFVMAIYGSISRLLAISVAVVFVACVAGLAINGRKMHSIFTVGLALIGCFAIASQFTYFSDGFDTFMARWEQAKGGEDGSVEEAIIGRVVGDFTHPFTYADYFDLIGSGLGIGTNIGAKFTTGSMGFTVGEGEWSRIIGELGILFGALYIVYRIALTAFLGLFALSSLRRNNLLPWLLWASGAFTIVSGQWGQQTTNGFVILTAGLVLAAGRDNAQKRK